MDIFQHASPAKPREGYESPIIIPKARWTALGDICRKNEHEAVMVVPADKVYSIRLDIRGMSRRKSSFNKKFVESCNETGYNFKFAEFMVSTMEMLMRNLSASYGFTQSDEITIIVSNSDNENFQHKWGGARDKLISDTSVTASMHFSRLAGDDFMFDARLAVWDSTADALRLVSWRAYDAGVNGVSDVIHGLPSKYYVQKSRKAMSCEHTGNKLDFLTECGMLPLPEHQAYGTMMHRTKRMVQGYNPKTEEAVMSLRHVYIVIPSCNIVNYMYVLEP